jgi:Gpi18-like mannosyltransferase
MRVKNAIVSNRNLLLLLLAGFMFRVLLFSVARHGDINNNISWGEELLKRGTVNFYEGLSWPFSAPNQPPLYLYLFGIVSAVISSISFVINYLNSHLGAFPSSLVWWWGTNGELLVAKLPSIIADTAIAAVLSQFFTNKRQGLLAAAFWLMNPVIWYNSGIWGGTDSVVNLLGLISFYFLFRKKLTKSSVFLVLSLLFKGSLALFVPLWLLVVFYQKFSLERVVKAIVLSGIVTIIISFPFHPSLDLPVWLFNLYTQRFFPGEIGSLTANAFNFWWLVDPGKTLDSTVFLGLTARVWGTIAMLSLYGVVILKIKKNISETQVVFAASLVALVSFLFMTRIHERYLYPLFPFLTLFAVKYKWARIPLVLLSLINLANLYHLFWAPGIDSLKTMYVNPMFMVFLSLASLFVFLFLFVRYLLFRTSGGDNI